MNKPIVRVLLYSHDSQGLGHVRRNLTIAHHIAKDLPDMLDCEVSGLLVSGLQSGSMFPLPSGFDWITIPGITKRGKDYHPRSLGGSTENLIQLRSNLLKSTLLSFAPHLVIIDRHILGVWKELQEPLQALRKAVPYAQVILGLRDILDTPESAVQEWALLGDADHLGTIIDQVWVYGDPQVHDPVASGEVPPWLVDKVRYTGFLAEGRRVADHDMELAPKPFILTTAGGGSDGFQLLRATVQLEVPDAHTHIVITGPQSSAAEFRELQQLAAPHTEIHHSWPGLSTQIQRASAVISMGGYNTSCEILASDTPALIIPREYPRQEQLIRAQSFQKVGAVEYLRLSETTPAALSAWVRRAAQNSIDRSHIKLDGLTTAAKYAAECVKPAIIEGAKT